MKKKLLRSRREKIQRVGVERRLKNIEIARLQTHWLGLMFNKRRSTGVNGAAVSTVSELLSRFTISGLFVHASLFRRSSPLPSLCTACLRQFFLIEMCHSQRGSSNCEHIYGETCPI